MEIKVMEAIANVLGNHKCVRLQHYTTDRTTFSYRLYMSYHPRGDLSNFTSDQSKHKGRLPEPALLKWFEDLTEASFLLSKGAEPWSDAKDGWKKIVHCDIKPQNIFLDNSCFREPASLQRLLPFLPQAPFVCLLYLLFTV